MAASYPTATKSFSTKATNDTIEASHVNDLQDEVTAVETGLRSGLAHNLIWTPDNTFDIGATGATRARDLFLSRNAVIAGTVTADTGSFTTATVAGNSTFTGNVTQVTGERLTGFLSPAQITADQNDYNPAGLSTARILRLSTDASHNITGLAAISSGARLTLWNSGSFNVVLVHNSGSSSAGNRFLLPGSVNFTLGPFAGVEIFYDSSSAWVLIS